MTASTLAVPAAIREEHGMSENAPKPGSQFERDATETLSQIKQILSDMLANLGVRRPVELQRMLKLDVTLSWQIFKVAADRSVLASGASMPSRTNIEKFARNASLNGVAQADIVSLAAAYDRFEKVVERHAGDRTSFISLVTAAAGLSDDWLAADLQHRRHMYRGMSHVMGVQARARLVSYLVAESGQDPARPFELLAVHGYVNVRTLRAVDRVRMHGMRVRSGKDAHNTYDAVIRPLQIAGAGGMLDEFCSQPLPKIQVDSGEFGDDHWTSTSLIAPEVANLGIATVMFAGALRMRKPQTRVNQVSVIPSEVLVQDLLVPKRLIEGEPRLDVYLGDDRPADRAPDLLPVIGKHDFERLGEGSAALTNPELGRYPEMIRKVAGSVGVDLAEYEVWRTRIEYPVYQSTVRVSWTPKKSAGGNA